MNGVSDNGNGKSIVSKNNYRYFYIYDCWNEKNCIRKSGVLQH